MIRQRRAYLKQIAEGDQFRAVLQRRREIESRAARQVPTTIDTLYARRHDDDQHRLAEIFLERYRIDGFLTLRFWKGKFWLLKGDSAQILPPLEVRTHVYTAVYEEFGRLAVEAHAEWTARGRKRREPSRQRVSAWLITNVVLAIKSLCHLDSSGIGVSRND